MGFFNVYPYLNVNDLNLDWIITHFRTFMDEISSLESWRSEHEEEYKELKIFMDKINAGWLPSSIYSELRDWIERNATDIIGELVKMVFFNISEDGYFVAFIPDSWADIIFNTTGHDITIAGIDYGHLVLSY